MKNERVESHSSKTNERDMNVTLLSVYGASTLGAKLLLNLRTSYLTKHCSYREFYRGGGGGSGGLPGGGGGGVEFTGGEEILRLMPLFAGRSLLMLPETGTL